MMPQRPSSVQSPFGLGPAFDERSQGDRFGAKIGKVYLVGAGPGDPGLLTLRGAECLAQADLVLYDGLANAKLLRLAPHAEWVCVSKHGSGPLWSQADINAQLVSEAEQGRQVVRLKGGDPAVFARTAEELEALAGAGVPFEVVPGITAALAAASYVGIPITHRDYASAVAFITGQQQADGAQELDWAALARFPGTLVFYMGVTTAAEWSGRLMAEGKPPETPAAIVRRCSWSDQRVIRCTLGDVASQLTPAKRVRPPVIVIIGEVTRLGERFNWFETRPLAGVGVWLTRPAGQNQWLERHLAELGADVYEQPAIEIAPPEDFSEFDAAIARLAEGNYDAVAFTSRNAVNSLLGRVWERGYDLRILSRSLIACVGSKTAEGLAEFGLRADIVPEHEFHSTALLDALTSRGLIKNRRWLLPQADQARETLAEGLADLGARVDRVCVYRTVPATELAPEIRAALERKAIQWVTVTSPNMARTLRAICQPYLGHLKPVSLSPTISETLQQLGWPARAQAAIATEESLVDALLAAAKIDS